MLNLKIIIGSTRPGRKGPSIAAWVHEVAKKHPEFATELIDLAEVNLPFLDEPQLPMMRQYEKQHTKDWSAKIDPADAIVLVTPEYNYGMTAPVKNAFDFLYWEWAYKPIAFVSYGGLAAGTRSVQMLKQLATTVRMMPLVESVNIPAFFQQIGADGTFTPNAAQEKAAEEMFKELARWAEALKPMRVK